MFLAHYLRFTFFIDTKSCPKHAIVYKTTVIFIAKEKAATEVTAFA